MHRYLIRLANPKKFLPEQALVLMIEFRKKVDPFRAVVKNFRLSDVAIEFDLFCTDLASKEKAIQALSSDYGKLLSERDLGDDRVTNAVAFEGKERVVQLSIELFNEQRYWECHETLEQIWRKEKNPDEKALQQGVILAASALVHAQKGERKVCLGIIPRAVKKLDQWKDVSYYSLDVKRLKESLRMMQEKREIVYLRV